MRLFFPGGEHPEVELKAGETAIGFASDGAVRVPCEALPERRASLFQGPLGLWLHCADASTCHLNGRPIHELAFLRVGDVVIIDRLRIVLKSDRLPGSHAADARAEAADADRVGCVGTQARQVLRGLSGHCAGQTFALVDSLVIGSGPMADVRLAEPGIEAQWIRIERDGNRLKARTLASGREFEVNGWRVEAVTLVNGDQLVCGAHRFAVELPELLLPEPLADSAAPSPPTPSRASPEPDASALGAGWWLVFVAAAVGAVTTVLLL
ncbi:MAG: hypothetical protein CVV17_11335 [Gammaproteobacteria bacterium HGW-Gammaproteobacteria-7]|nr:MAG: hypothetical protein CVV17_11335 [Gammaproteobacteria bacterium HGW-Gammaproteobacteria-7]